VYYKDNQVYSQAVVDYPSPFIWMVPEGFLIIVLSFYLSVKFEEQIIENRNPKVNYDS